MKYNLSLLLMLILGLTVQSQNSYYKKVDSLLQSQFSDAQPGLSIAVIKDGEDIFDKSYGLANLEYQIKITDSSVFDVASIAKQFTAACIWYLVQQNKISLDDDIRKYLPEIPSYGDTLRIRHLLNHTSGLRNYATILDLAGYDYTKHFFTNDSILTLMSRQKNLNNKPGEKVLYGNTPFNLLTIIVERISKTTFIDFATKHIFTPIGMKNTKYRVNNTSIVKNRAVGYIKENDTTFSQFPRIESCYGGGSLWSTTKDLAIWSNLFTQQNTNYEGLVNFLLTKEMLTNGIEASYSRGLMESLYKGYKTIHHSGNTRGYRSQVISIPEIQLSVIILANSNAANPVALSYQLIDLFIPEKVVETKLKQSRTNPSSSELREFEGTYQELNSCLKMHMVLNDGFLTAKSSLGSAYIKLKSTSLKSFCRSDNESVTYLFEKQKESDLLVYFGATPFYFEKIVLTNPEKISNSDFEGRYYSSELDVFYTLKVDNGRLLLSYPNNANLELYPARIDEFGNGYRTNYLFYRDLNGTVNRISVASDGSVKDIEFNKVE